jgi:hypothetical protein
MPLLPAEAPPTMPAIEHDVAVRVARRFVARVRAERVGREVQRRRDGLETVGDEDEEDPANAPPGGAEHGHRGGRGSRRMPLAST